MFGNRRLQRGFTLIELVAVMAILAILVAIVAPAAINSQRASIEAQAQADSQQVRNAASEFFKDQNEAEVRTPHTVTLTAQINGATSSPKQVVSSRWPEVFVTDGTGAPTLSNRSATSSYSDIFEVNGNTANKVVNIVLKGKDGTQLSTSDSSSFLADYTAIDLVTLNSTGRLSKLPDGVDQFSPAGVDSLQVPNFLWLFRRTNSTLGAGDDRDIAVFLLVNVVKIEPTGGGTATTINVEYVQVL